MTSAADQCLKINCGDRVHDSFPVFDWLRFILASVVALTHEGLIGWHQAGNLSVQVFFALSGWLIGGILLKTKREGIPRFYFNRATRIWIPYFCAVAALYGLSAFVEGADSNFFHFLVIDLTFTHNWLIDIVPAVTHVMPFNGAGNHFWSISVEEQFYLAAPLMIMLLTVGKSTRFWVVVAIATIISQWWYGAISLGVLAAVLRKNLGEWHLRCRLALVGIGMASAVILYLLPASYGLMAPIFAVTIVLLSAVAGPRNSLGEFVGGVSYPLYLYHWVGAFALSFAKHRGVNLPTISAYLISVVAGGAMYLVIDRNVMKHRNRFYSAHMGKILMAAAYGLVIVGLLYGSRDNPRPTPRSTQTQKV